ncbi:hypothetical protein CkaCkLH20_12227 [Colletotrichum karsti]|uniref:Uncharacterized protein n=1 Tax=Colletotrichum karsti TaxID=1095194 RepID=A0A9P6HSU7_9PEZI|nr:uncharacterized protein CkaCkLH20_12227 [Colletotrichum karsti]KAF9870263.1 hypothetical protein CkaCkLH20_12227 [Colletotrichum karsti]
MSPAPVATRKTVHVGSLARVPSRSESPDPISLPGVTDFRLSQHDFLTDDQQLVSMAEDDTESNSTSFTQTSDDPASSGDESWSPRSKGRFSAKLSKSPLSPSTKNSVNVTNVSPTAERQLPRDRDIYDIPSDTDNESSKRSQPVLARSLSLDKLKKPKVTKKQRKSTKKHAKRRVRKRAEGHTLPAVQRLDASVPHIAASSEQSFKDSVYEGRSDKATRELKEQQSMRIERFVHSWMSFNEAVTTEMTKEKAAERSREVFEGEPMLWL